VIASSALAWISRHGPLGLGSLLALGVVGIPLPDEILLTFAGSLIARGQLPLPGTLLAAIAGAAVGITLSYAAGRFAGARLLGAGARRGLIPPRRVDATRRWFERTGRWGLVVGYFVPGVRHLTALVAGSVGLPFPQFATFAWLGAALWCCTFVTLGMALGREWHLVADVLHHHLVQLGISVAVAIAVVVGLGWLRRRLRAQDHDADPGKGPPGPGGPQGGGN